MSRTLKNMLLGILMVVIIGASAGCTKEHSSQEGEHIILYATPYPGDVCENIDGRQEALPEGMVRDNRYPNLSA